jgi:hypothetical protein
MIKIEQNLSKNIICSWEIIKQKHNNNIISCSYFIKKDSYKDNDHYINGLINLINNFNNILPNYNLRIYYDDTVNDILKNILKDKDLINIELYKYNIEFLKEDIYHKGVIGMFMRFLPLFDIEYHKVNKCIVFDIDNKLHNFYSTIIDYFDKYDIKIAYRSRFCYLNRRVIVTKNKFPLIASFIYQSIQLPFKIFSNFFEKLYIDNNKKIIKLINKSELINIYEYGIDELFLNKYYIKYINKHKLKFIIVLFNHIDIYIGFYKYIKYYCKDIIKIWNILCNFFKIMEYDLNQIYNYNDLNKENILDFLDNNKQFLEIKIKKNLKNILLKEYILKEINITNNKKLKLLLNCILNNLDIDINKINLRLIENNKIKYYKYINF